jgi:hypothetical protein
MKSLRIPIVLALRITLGSLNKNFKPEFRKTTLQLFIRSLHEVHAANAYKADHVWLSVRMIQLESLWTDLDEI